MDQVMQSPEVGELVEAIAQVTGAVGYVQKTGRNTHHRYTYASDEDLARAIGPALAEHGLAIMPHRIDTTRDGDRVTLIVTWRIAHESGQWMTIATVGEGCDKQDKAAYKAMTGARKYLLRLVFCIATGDDAEIATPADAGPSAKEELYRMAREAAGDDVEKLAKSIDYVDNLTESQARAKLAQKRASR